MKLHCLGTAGYHPNEFRHTSCYFVPECGLVLDAGTGFFRIGPLLKGTELHILLSHAHLDHIVGLTFVLDLLATTSLKKIFVYGEEEKLEAIRAHLFAPLLFPVVPPVEWIALESLSPQTMICGARIQWKPMVHPGGSIGFRIDWNEVSLAYVTDTVAQPEASYWDMIRGADILLHECNFLDSQQGFAVDTGHSWPEAVIAGARRTLVKHLILTHFDPLQSMDEPKKLIQRDEFPRVSCAEDGDSFPLLD